MALSKGQEAHRKRAQAAWAKREQWNKVLSDAYDFVAPHRRSTRRSETSPQAKTDRLFDNHAANALHRAVGKLLVDVFPAGEAHFALEPGPLVSEEDYDAAAKELEALSAQMHPCFWQGDFDGAAAGMFTDGMISTGFMMIAEGDKTRPVKWVDVPQDEMAVDSGPFGALHGFFWKRQWSRRAIMEAWPKGKYSPEFVAEKDKDGEAKVTLCQDVTYDAGADRWRLCVYLEQGKDEDIHEEASETCPIIGFRYFKLPGEDYGFGPVLMNLPLIKTLNKVAELALKGAALNALGIFTRIDDGVFNPDTARLEPGAFWTVARNGGPIGPSIQRLQGGSDPNLNMITIQDLRQSISAGMNDEELPPQAGTPRSASEIIERTRRLRQNHAGAFSRIMHDVFLAMLPRVQEILKKLGVIKKPVKIDQLLVRVKILSPLGQAFRARQAETYAEFVQVTSAIGGPEALRAVTPLERGLAQMGRDMGVPASLVYSPSEQEMLAQRVKEGVAAAMEAMKAQGPAAPPPPANGDPAQAGM